MGRGKIWLGFLACCFICFGGVDKNSRQPIDPFFKSLKLCFFKYDFSFMCFGVFPSPSEACRCFLLREQMKMMFTDFFFLWRELFISWCRNILPFCISIPQYLDLVMRQFNGGVIPGRRAEELPPGQGDEASFHCGISFPGFHGRTTLEIE